MKVFSSIVMTADEPVVKSTIWLRPVNNAVPGKDGHIDDGYSPWYFNNGEWKPMIDFDVRKDMDAFIKDLQKQISELTDTVTSLENEVKSLKTTVNSLTSRVSALEQ